MSLNEVVKEALKDGLMKIWREESEEHTRKIGEYYPSGIGYCLRKQYYEYKYQSLLHPKHLLYLQPVKEFMTQLHLLYRSPERLVLSTSSSRYSSKSTNR